MGVFRFLDFPSFPNLQGHECAFLSLLILLIFKSFLKSHSTSLRTWVSAFLSDPTPQTSAAPPPGAHAAGSLAGGGRRAGAGEATESPEGAPPCAQHVLVDTRPPRPNPTPGCQSPSRRTRPEPAEQWQTARWGDGLLRAAGRLQHGAVGVRVVTVHTLVPPRGRCSKPEPLGVSGRGACELPGCFARSPCRGPSGRELRLTPQGPEAVSSHEPRAGPWAGGGGQSGKFTSYPMRGADPELPNRADPGMLCGTLSRERDWL